MIFYRAEASSGRQRSGNFMCEALMSERLCTEMRGTFYREGSGDGEGWISYRGE